MQHKAKVQTSKLGIKILASIVLILLLFLTVLSITFGFVTSHTCLYNSYAYITGQKKFQGKILNINSMEFQDMFLS